MVFHYILIISNYPTIKIKHTIQSKKSKKKQNIYSRKHMQSKANFGSFIIKVINLSILTPSVTLLCTSVTQSQSPLPYLCDLI